MPNWETASDFGPLEYGGGGYISRVDDRTVLPAIKTERFEDGRVLRGYACLYNKSAWTGDGIVRIIRPGAFSETLSKRKKVEFWINHSEAMCVGSTSKELELLDSPTGLAFKFAFPDTTLGNYARDLAAENEYSAMSVGLLRMDYRYEEIEGLNVCIVNKAELEEISFVRRGAIESAFGLLADPDEHLTEVPDTKLALDGAYIKMIRALQALKELEKAK